MTDWLIGGAIGFVAAVVVIWLVRRKLGRSPAKADIVHSITQLRAVGELVAFRLVTQQIVTADEHPAGQFGKNWLKWLLSGRKMAMVIEYGIDFKYNLRDSAFQIHDEGEQTFRLVMPPCQYDAHVRNIQFYDEQSARWLPWLLGEVTEALGPGFDESDKNRLMADARREADAKARQMAGQLQSEVHSSARQTLEVLARSFGAEHVTIQFGPDNLVGEEQAGAAQPAGADANDKT